MYMISLTNKAQEITWFVDIVHSVNIEVTKFLQAHTQYKI